MEGSISTIRISPKLTTGEFSSADFNGDVIVRFDNGEEFVGAFSTFENLEVLINSRKSSPEYFSVNYYKVLNTVLVSDFCEGNLQPVIEHMILEGDFQLVFKRV